MRIAVRLLADHVSGMTVTLDPARFALDREQLESHSRCRAAVDQTTPQRDIQKNGVAPHAKREGRLRNGNPSGNPHLAPR